MANAKITHVSEEKKRQVAELSQLVKDKNTILLVSIKGIPASQYQEIVKKLRGKAVVKVPKKSAISRAFDSPKDETIKSLKDHVRESTAVLFSDEDAFDISAELLSKKTPVGAKAGQEAPEDIEVQAGPTELVPGPAISELGAVGIQIQIDKGKIAIKENKVIVKKGEKISAAAADIMNKLGIKPFSIGFIPIAAFDAKGKKIYTEIKIDREKTLEDLKYAFSRALPFAVEIGYANDETIKFLLAKAAAHGRALEKYAEQKVPKATEEKAAEENNPEGAESGSADTQNKSEEEK